MLRGGGKEFLGERPPNVARLSECAAVVKRFDPDRFFCSLFAPPAERKALLAVYAFNVEVATIRERVREPLLGHIRLQWWAEAIEAVYAGRPPHHPVSRELAVAVERFALSSEHFERLLATRAFDLEDAPPLDLEALIAYAEGSSGPLASLALQILSVDDSVVAIVARDIAIAWALIGLMRAVPFHARTRRSYLPQALVAATGLDLNQLFKRAAAGDRAAVPVGLAKVVETIITDAEERLRSARSHRGAVIKRALPATLPAILADDYLRRLRRAMFDPFDPRVHAPSPFRLGRLALNAFRGRF